MGREHAMEVIERCAADTIPPLHLRILAGIVGNPDSTTSDVVKRPQFPRKTVDRALQELHVVMLATVDRSTAARA